MTQTNKEVKVNISNNPSAFNYINNNKKKKPRKTY